jgi:casein kinase I family protein HRR25
MSNAKLPSSYKDPKIFNNKFIVKNQISSGSFGVVYLAHDKYTKEEVAVKLEKEENEDVCTLEREITILARLDGVDGVPKLFWSGFE